MAADRCYRDNCPNAGQHVIERLDLPEPKKERACEPHALRLLRAEPHALAVIWCGRCRRGEHEKCRALRGATKAMHGGLLLADEYCCCTCNPYDERVPGANYARQPYQPLVGVGSVCRRQGTDEAGAIFEALHSVGVTRLHGFGLKKTGLAKFGHLLASADSMAWSFDARRKPPLPGCIGHRNCANCPRYALKWRDEVLAGMGRAEVQPSLFAGVA